MERFRKVLAARTALFEWLVISPVIIGVCFLSCSKKTPTAPTQGEVQISPSVVVLPDSTMTYLHHQDSTNYYFTKGTNATTVLKNLQPGNIIASGVGEGILRKVTAIQEDPTYIIVQTGKARLDEAILKGGINTEFTLAPEGLLQANSLQGVTLSPQGGNFYLTFDRVIWTDPQSGATIKLTGNTAFSPTVKFGVHWDNGVDTLGAGLTVGQQSSVALSASQAISLLDKEITLTTLRFKPISFMVGPVPVVIVPQLKIVLGANASVQEGITTTTGLIDTIRGGIIYKQKTWSPYSSYSQYFTYSPPQLTLSGDAKGYVLIPKLELYLYGFVGPTADLEGYSRIHAQVGQTPLWTLYAGLSGQMGIETDILGLITAGYRATLFEREWEVANSGTTAPWTTKSSMINLRSQLAVAAVNNKVYAIGGVNGSCLTFVEEYDPGTDKWTAKGSMPSPTGNFVAEAVNNKIYVIGGENNYSAIDTLREYDPLADIWMTKSPMPTVRAGLAATSVSGKIYAIGGWNGSNILSTVEEYDPLTDTWTPKASMLAARSNLTAVAVNNKIYAIGGWDGSTPFSTVEEYNPTTNSWIRKEDLPTARWDLRATALNGKIYVFGGYNIGGILNTVEMYDPSTGIWMTKYSMPTPRGGLVTSDVNQKIYAIGGYNNSGNLATVEMYDPSRDQ